MSLDPISTGTARAAANPQLQQLRAAFREGRLAEQRVTREGFQTLLADEARAFPTQPWTDAERSLIAEELGSRAAVALVKHDWQVACVTFDGQEPRFRAATEAEWTAISARARDAGDRVAAKWVPGGPAHAEVSTQIAARVSELESKARDGGPRGLRSDLDLVLPPVPLERPAASPRHVASRVPMYGELE